MNNLIEAINNNKNFTLVGSRFYNLSHRKSSHDYAALKTYSDNIKVGLIYIFKEYVMKDYNNAVIRIFDDGFDKVKLFVFDSTEDLNDFIEKNKKIEKFTSSMSYEYRGVLINTLSYAGKIQNYTYHTFKTMLSFIDYKHDELSGFVSYLNKETVCDDSSLCQFLTDILCYLYQHKVMLSKGLFVPEYPTMDKLTMDDIYPASDEFISMYQALQSNIHCINLLANIGENESTDSNIWGRERQLESLKAVNSLIINMLQDKERDLRRKVNLLKQRFEGTEI
jgi:hypothetical protein